MERSDSAAMSDDEFVDRILHEINAGADLSTIDNNDLTDCDGLDENLQLNENDGIKKPKLKRRSNLTEFNDSQSTKRKNESAKRELTSIVNQVCPLLVLHCLHTKYILSLCYLFINHNVFCSLERLTSS